MVNDEGLVIIRTALIFRGAHQAKASSSHITYSSVVFIKLRKFFADCLLVSVLIKLRKFFTHNIYFQRCSSSYASF